MKLSASRKFYSRHYRLLLLLTSFLLYFVPLEVSGQNTSDAAFEGVIKYNLYTSAGQQTSHRDITYMAKGHNARIEFKKRGQVPMTVLVDTEKRQITMLMDQSKSYMTFPLRNPDPPSTSTPGHGNFKIERMDQTQQIAGRTCQLWRVTQEGQSVDIWIARDIRNFLPRGTKLPSRMGPLALHNRPSWLDELINKGLMPFKITVNSTENPQTILKAQSIHEKSLTASLFTVPDGYQNMNQMMRQMLEQQKDGR